MIITALILGLISSLHCVVMCGPIAMALPIGTFSKSKQVGMMLTYHFGRIATYSYLGVLIGIMGRFLKLAGVQNTISIAIGSVLILAVVFSRYKTVLESPFLFKLWSKFKTFTQPFWTGKSVKGFFVLGSLNGLLPCGMVYIALVQSIAQENMGMSILTMLFFGLGTLPAMLMVHFLGSTLTLKSKLNLQKLVPLVVVVMGGMLIVRGLNLDIPYLSPNVKEANVQLHLPASMIKPVGCD